MQEENYEKVQRCIGSKMQEKNRRKSITEENLYLRTLNLVPGMVCLATDWWKEIERSAVP